MADPMILVTNDDGVHAPGIHALATALRDAGVPTAAFQVVDGEAAPPPFAPPYFIKPVAEGTGKGVTPASIVRRREDLAPACRALQARFRQPVLVEAFLPGREFTVGIVGTGGRAEAIGTMEVHLLPAAEAEVYSYANKENSEELVEYSLRRPQDDPVVAESEHVALAAWRVLVHSFYLILIFVLISGRGQLWAVPLLRFTAEAITLGFIGAWLLHRHFAMPVFTWKPGVWRGYLRESLVMAAWGIAAWMRASISR